MIAQVENVNLKKSKKILKDILFKSNSEPYPLDFFKKAAEKLRYNTEIDIDRDLPIECRGVYIYVERA